MRIIIIGAGEIGYSLAKNLSYENHDIAVIEGNRERYARVSEFLDVQAVRGSGTSYSALEQAEIRDADMLVGVTTNDEVNLIASLIAKKCGVEKTIARIKNLEFLNENAPLRESDLGVDLLIHPESESSVAATRLLKETAATDVIEFEEGRINLMGIRLTKDCALLYKSLIDIAKLYPHIQFRVVAIERKDITRIPTGKDSLHKNDRIFVSFKSEAREEVLKLFGKENSAIEDVMILGGGQIGYLMANELQKEHNVKLIESDTEKLDHLAEKLEKALVIRGDGRDINLLALEGIADMDAFIAATGDDETNIITCLMAKHLEVPRTISFANKTDYLPIFPTIGIDAYISKQKITVDRIMKFIRKGDIVSVASFPGVAAEAIEFIAKAGSKITRKPLTKLRMPKNTILGAVLSDNEVFIPVGETQIKPGDKVVVFALPSAIADVEKMFN